MTPRTVDEYIAACSPEAQPILQKIRTTVRRVAPGAQEKISYRMPSFHLKGALIYLGAFKKHIGLYPPVRGDKSLMKEVSVYAGEKGNLKFPLDKAIPYALIVKIVKARITENQKRFDAGRAKKG